MAFMTSSTSGQGVAYARIGAATIVTRYRAGDLDQPTHDLVDRYREVVMAMGDASKPIIDDAVRVAIEKWAEALSEQDEDTESRTRCRLLRRCWPGTCWERVRRAEIAHPKYNMGRPHQESAEESSPLTPQQPAPSARCFRWFDGDLS